MKEKKETDTKEKVGALHNLVNDKVESLHVMIAE